VIQPLADKLQVPYRIFDLNDSAVLLGALREVKVVINAAGPFEFTAKPMVLACLLTGTHYLDLNGDIDVFEQIKHYDEAARKTGIMLLPGAGFDVVPTDCVAMQLKKILPDAFSLKLAFANLGGGLSHGTATTMADKSGESGAVRKNGIITPAPIGQSGMMVDFGIKKIFVTSIPWGDISTAYFSTDIPNIETFTGIPKKMYPVLKLQPLYNWLLRRTIVRNYIKKIINQRPAGPSDEQRNNATSLIWGQATNTSGETATVRLSGPDAYTLTAYSALIIVQKILNGNMIPGYQTPASAYGENLVMEIPGIHREIVG